MQLFLVYTMFFAETLLCQRTVLETTTKEETQ